MANFPGEFLTLIAGEDPLVGECIDALVTQTVILGQATEINVARPMVEKVQIGFATETDVALPMLTIDFFPFLTITEADERCEQKMADGSWVVCHSQRIIDGQISVRFQRFMSPLDPDFGKWEFLLDKTIN